MRKPVQYILVLFILFGKNAEAQNLVPDWSFEYKNDWGCIDNDSLKWFNPYYGYKANGLNGADYAGCRGSNCSNCTPKNDAGYQLPRHGKNYEALDNGYLTTYNDTGYRSYGEIGLSAPLVKDSLYYCGFF